MGAELPRAVGTGEVVAVSTTDSPAMGNAMDITARMAGAIVSFGSSRSSCCPPPYGSGLVVLIGVPLLLLALGPLLRPLHHRQGDHRPASASSPRWARTPSAACACCAASAARRPSSPATSAPTSGCAKRVYGWRARSRCWTPPRSCSRDCSWSPSPGWAPAPRWRSTITIGELVAFYGYSAFLVTPLRTATEAAEKLLRAHVAAKRVIRVLAARADAARPADPVAEPPADATIIDTTSGAVVRPGLMTALVSAEPEETARIADRLGRYADPAAGFPVRIDGTSAGRPAPVGGTRGASSSTTATRGCSPGGCATSSTRPAAPRSRT